MAITNNINDRQKDSFTELSSGEVARRVLISGGNGFLSDVEFDYIAATYPSSTQEVYTYKAGGSGGTTVATITVNYTDANKTSISSVAKT